MSVEAEKETGTRGRRAGLTRDRVLEAAIELIDRDGLDSFSLRRLAVEVVVEPMSLYNHVANKDDLLDGVVEVILGKLAADGPPTGSWQNQVRSGAAMFRDVLLSHPQVSILVLTRRVLTDLPVEVLRTAITPLLTAGLPPSEAVVVLRTFTAFLTGSVLRELGSALTFATIDPSVTNARIKQLSESADPVLAETAEAIARVDHQAVFQHGVELFIAGLGARLMSG